MSDSDARSASVTMSVPLVLVDGTRPPVLAAVQQQGAGPVGQLESQIEEDGGVRRYGCHFEPAGHVEPSGHVEMAGHAGLGAAVTICHRTGMPGLRSDGVVVDQRSMV